MSLIERRIGLLFALFTLALVVVVARASWIQGVRGSELRADAQSQQTETVEVPGSRGAILDRNGTELAVSEDAATIFATPYQVKDPPKTADKLAEVLHLDSGDLLEQLTKPDSGFEYIAHKVDLPTAEKIRKLDLAGIGTLPDSRRIYPQGELASQVIGSVGDDTTGLTGIEASEDDTLHGTDGERQIVRDALGKELERDSLETAEPGSDIELTIDASLQARTEDVLAAVADTYHPKGATAIVMNPRTGEILALANTPASDPADPAAASPQELANRA